MQGLTAATGLWMTAAIGIACGPGREAAALLSTLLALLVPALAPRLVARDRCCGFALSGKERLRYWRAPGCETAGFRVLFAQSCAAAAFNNRAHAHPHRRLGGVRGQANPGEVMSTAAAVEGAVPVKTGKKKLVVALVAALLLLAVVGGGVVFWLKSRAHAQQDAEDADAGAEVAHAKTAPKRDPKAVPVFVPLDNFTVNLADREADRYAQIGISLELSDAKAGDRIKLFMPAIRNNILMVLAHKRSSDLLERSGKEKLADEVLRETERALGLEPLVAAAPGKKTGADDEPRPVRAVHFSNFIIQ
jgi:flagellar FliL protein